MFKNTQGLKEFSFQLSEQERKAISVLIIDESGRERSILRQSLNRLGLGPTRACPSFSQGLELLSTNAYSHLMFSTRPGHEISLEFLTQAIRIKEDLISFPMAPTAPSGKVFEMIRAGARGFIVTPFTSEDLFRSLSFATKTAPKTEFVNSLEQNPRCLGYLVANHLDQLARALKATGQEISDNEIPQILTSIKQIIMLGQAISGTDHSNFVKVVSNCFLEIANQQNSHFTRLEEARKRLSYARQQKVEDLDTSQEIKKNRTG